MSGKRELAEALGRMLGDVGDKAARTIGDMSDTVSSKARFEAAQRMIKDTADKADDWGWKGGKPGEITGSELDRLARRVDIDNYNGTVLGESSKYSKEYKNELADAQKQAVKQINALRSKDPEHYLVRTYDLYRHDFGNSPREAATQATIQHFKPLEDAGVPREWTNKVLKAWTSYRQKYNPILGSRVGFSPYTISDKMRGMYVKDDPAATLRARETFLSLLPSWEGTLDELAQVAKTL